MSVVYWCAHCDMALESCPHHDDPDARQGVSCAHAEVYQDSEFVTRCVVCDQRQEDDHD